MEEKKLLTHDAAEYDIRKAQFDSYDEFLQWKEQWQWQTRSNFVNVTGCKRNSGTGNIQSFIVIYIHIYTYAYIYINIYFKAMWHTFDATEAAHTPQRLQKERAA